MSDRPPSEDLTVSGILAAADQDHANRILQAMHQAAQGASMATVWWTIAQAQAGVLASAPPELQVWLAARLGDLCQAALPAALEAAARARGGDVALPSRAN